MSLTGENKQIKFPKTHYVGMIGRKEDVLPLGFMTPDGTDKAAQKRKGTVDDWVANATRYRQEDHKIAATRVLDNVPLIGFRLTRQIKRDSGWGSGNVKWRIEDPRGFELEITSPNMARVIDSCVIDNGEILEECVWARLGAENILVPISSDLYQAAQRNEERVAAKVKPSEVERGDTVVLHNGNEGVYLGKFECFERNYRYREDHRNMFEYAWKSKPVHALLQTSKDHAGNDFEHIHTFATFKPSYVTKREGGPLTPEEAEAEVWSKGGGRRYYSEKLFLEKREMKFTETPTTLAEAYAPQTENDTEGHLVCMQGDVMYAVHMAQWQYDEYVKQKNAPAPATPPARSIFGSYGYSQDRLSAEISKVTRDEQGNYIVHGNTGYSRHKLKIEELEKLPLLMVSATIELADGTTQVLQ